MSDYSVETWRNSAKLEYMKTFVMASGGSVTPSECANIAAQAKAMALALFPDNDNQPKMESNDDE